MLIEDVIKNLNRYLGMDLTPQEFVNHTFTGSEIIEAFTNRGYDSRLPGPDWIKVDEDTYEHPQLFSMGNKHTQYTFEEARAIQCGWNTSK